ncbi:DUF3239 domain-containing protein [Corynebacterium sp. Q4381]|uniref:DUF3239 domain-containing protein n=1 Tax=Corynebacterium sp. Marseille-Q4381 TaxID=3121597 RepID=UPI002FE5672E
MSEMKVFKFDVDEAYAKQHNEMLRNTKYLVISGVALFIISLAAAAAVWFLVDPSSPWHILGSIGLALFGVMMLIVALAIPRSVGKVQQLYDAHPLSPAIITENHGTAVTLTALVNANVDPDLPPRWALTSLVTKPIPGAHDTTGTKIPVTAVGAQQSVHDKAHWQVITPMPIAWATPDPDVVTQARTSIPHRQWQTLEHAAKDSELVEASKKTLQLL